MAQGHGTSLPGTAWTWHCDIRGEHGDNYEVQCGSAVRKKPRFTHVRDNLGGDVSGKRFSTHAMERNEADVAQERLSDGTGCTDMGLCYVGIATAQRHSGI